jgi:hypothetical protein
MKKIFSILLILATGLGLRARADEGMWLLPLIEKLNIGKMTELGLKLSAEDIYSLNRACLKDAVIIFGGGCTGEIVSSQGLILTNHHCGYSSIQSHSTVEHDYLKDGFWAKSKEEELPNPGLAVTFLIRVEEVTSQILANVKDGMSESDRNNAISEARQAVQKKATEGTGYTATVSNFYSGNYYYLLIYERYNDVRLVGAPPTAIGKFGADTDNWEWPRHTGDFSVFRVYSAPDGKPAPYSKNNIPLKPKYYLSVSLKDLNKGDFAMVMGYPGRTSRYATSYELEELLKITDPGRIKIRGIKQDNWMADMKADAKVNIQYASKYSSSSNYWKNAIGEKIDLEKLNVVAQKQQTEDQFRKWVAGTPERQSKYGQALDLIKKAVSGRAEFVNVNLYISETFSQGCEILQLNQVATGLIEALKSGDQKKLAEFTARVKNNLPAFYKDYNPPTDRKNMKSMLKLYRSDVQLKYIPDFYANVIDRKFKGDIDKFVDDMFNRSLFADQAKLNAFLDKPVLKTIENDPVYLTATSINKVASEVGKNLSQFETDYAVGRRLWVAALMEMTPEKTLYPDANFTMRLTYGTVQDYEPKDGVLYKYYTSATGVLEKYKPGDYEFDVPQKQLDLLKNKEYGRYASSNGYLPVCFLTNNDITGGNSGSPVLNASGHLIGLAFDGNFEAISGNYAFEPSIQRTICVDIRYVLWVIDIYAGAKNIVDEMTLVK